MMIRGISTLLRIVKYVLLSVAAVVCCILLLVGAIYLYENRDPGYRRLSESEISHFVTSLDEYGQSPIEYVVGKFGRHPIVILGEPHRVREHYEFLIRLLLPLQKAGVLHVGIEFFLISSQEKIDRLLSGKEFDPQLAREIVLLPNILFYYQELYELLERAWELNQSDNYLRVVALGEYDVERRLRNTDFLMAEIASKIVDGSEKILIYCGTHHAFTRYSQPDLNFWRRPTRRGRMGNFLLDQFQKDPFFIQFHYPAFKRFWIFVPIFLYRQAYVLPFSGMLDQIFQESQTPVGFDADIPGFESVIESFSYYAQGYGSIRLKDFCDGYVYLNPTDEYHSVRPLEHIAATEEERQFIRSILAERLWYLFESEEMATYFLNKDGVQPEELWEMLDLRGLEHLF